MSLAPNTQAILLLTAPLIVGRAPRSSDLLKPNEYNRLARQLRDLNRQPGDLLGNDATELYRACAEIADEGRLRQLLGRGMLLTQAVEQWQKRAIWVLTRADAEYPQRLKSRLQKKTPAVLYGCGNKGLLANGGLAVVGSRHVDAALVDYTLAIGEQAAQAGKTIVSGGAKGIDQAAMRGALENGGCAIGVLADSLERAAMNRDNRALLIDERLVLVSPFDPRAGFNAGNAMQRNKFIYALADAALIVNSDMGNGGTWAGAVEQLDKLRLVPVYYRSTAAQPPAFAALQGKGAQPWPNPADAQAFARVLAEPQPGHAIPATAQSKLFVDNDRNGRPYPSKDANTGSSEASTHGVVESVQVHQALEEPPITAGEVAAARSGIGSAMATPAEVIFSGARTAIQKLLHDPMQGAEVAKALDVSPAQANIWLKRLVEEGSVEKLRNPVRYIARPRELFGSAQ
ncbi:MAG: DNA-processing protein DprA [Rhodanobacteraceae bacterium]